MEKFDPIADMQQLARTVEQYKSDPIRGLPSKYRPRGYKPSEEERLSRRLVLCRVESGEKWGRCSCYPGLCGHCCRWVDQRDVLDGEELDRWRD